MFLTNNDFQTVIEQDKLDKITDSNPALVDDAVRSAVAEMTSYLEGRYDVAASFAATGSDRNAFLVLRCVDLALYHLYSRISPRNIPDLRSQRYQDTLEWLKMVAKGVVSLNLPLRPIENQTGYILWGGNQPFRFR